jgi:hypothetical protein
MSLEQAIKENTEAVKAMTSLLRSASISVPVTEDVDQDEPAEKPAKAEKKAKEPKDKKPAKDAPTVEDLRAAWSKLKKARPSDAKKKFAKLLGGFKAETLADVKKKDIPKAIAAAEALIKEAE